MIKIVGVRFKNAGKIYYFDPVDLEIEKNMDVVVETARGLEYGSVVVGPKEISEEELVSPLKPIIRVATEEDTKIYLENKEKSKETFEICQQKIKSHGLTMYLIDCEYTFDRNKLIFYFTAEGRIRRFPTSIYKNGKRPKFIIKPYKNIRNMWKTVLLLKI